MSGRAPRPKIDVDFSLAVHTRTGKYFIGKDLFDACADMIGDVFYWRVRLDAPPPRLVGKTLGRLQYMHARRNLSRLGGLSHVGRASDRPMLHMDPFTISTNGLASSDVVICHDVGPLTHPDLFDRDICAAYSAIYAHLAATGPHVVFVSESSQRAFNDVLHLPPLASSTVIYPPIREVSAGSGGIGVENIRVPFLLTVGSIGSRKNQKACIEAFKLSGLHDLGVDYVICGGREPGYEEVVDVARSAAGVVLLSYVADSTLSWLYNSACGFVLMSRLEGFGIPVVEAIAHRLVPLVSRGGVLHEIAGEGAMFADQDDVLDIARSMLLLVNLSSDEVSVRRGLLDGAIRRFEFEPFRNRWRAVIEAALKT